MLDRKRTEINRQYKNESQVETEQQENLINRIQLETLKELPLQMKGEDEKLGR